MIGYLTQRFNPENKFLPEECPWVSWHYQDGIQLNPDCIIVSDEEFETIQAYYAPMVLSENRRVMYEKRAEVKDYLIGEMNNKNMERIEAGVWTVDLLKSILSDVHMANSSAFVDKLSFELAIQEIMLSTHPLLTNEIKSEYVSLLTRNLFK